MIFFVICLFLQINSDPVEIKMSAKPINSGLVKIKKIRRLLTEEGFYKRVSGTITPNGKSYYVLDAGNKKIHVFDEKGNLTHSFGKEGNGPGELSRPNDIFVTNKRILVIESTKGHLYNLKGELIKDINLLLGGKVGKPSVINDKLYLHFFDSKNPKYLFSEIKNDGNVDHIIENDSYKRSEGLSYSVGGQSRTLISNNTLFRAGDGAYKIIISPLQSPNKSTYVLSRDFKRVKETFYMSFVDPKTKKIVEKEEYKETSDITSIIGSYKNKIFVRVATKDHSALIDIIDNEEFVDQIILDIDTKYPLLKVVNDKMVLSGSDDENGPYIDIYQITVVE